MCRSEASLAGMEEIYFDATSLVVSFAPVGGGDPSCSRINVSLVCEKAPWAPAWITHGKGEPNCSGAI